MQSIESEDAYTLRSALAGWRWTLPVGAGLALVAILAAAGPADVPQSTSDQVPIASKGPPSQVPKNLATLEARQTDAPQKIWRVDRSGSLETYSNGLRVDVTFAEPHKPRVPYPVFPLAGGAQPVRFQSTPAGIVYHTTESNLADFDEAQNRRLKQLDRNLLEVVSEERAYHYVIDRFGRVFRVVEEGDIANHAGHSIWADASGVYVDLNFSFLAVAFEAQTGDPNSVTPAQIQSARMLTEMLRSKYTIPAANCVTHAQVSVSGVNTHIGAHVDWGSQFPFAAIGLPDNYTEPLPSITLFGFEYNSAFVKANGGRWQGLDRADAQLAREAAEEGMSVTRYRAVLQHRYSDVLGVVTAYENQNGQGG